mgnify:CR=1
MSMCSFSTFAMLVYARRSFTFESAPPQWSVNLFHCSPASGPSIRNTILFAVMFVRHFLHPRRGLSLVLLKLFAHAIEEVGG